MEDVLVQVDTFYYLIDFVVLNIEQSTRGISNIPIILGRPFLATSNALINCRNCLMQLTFGNMILEFNIINLVKKPKSYEDVLLDVYVIGNMVEEDVDDLIGHNLGTYYKRLDEVNAIFEPPESTKPWNYLGLVSSLRRTYPQ